MDVSQQSHSRRIREQDNMAQVRGFSHRHVMDCSYTKNCQRRLDRRCACSGQANANELEAVLIFCVHLLNRELGLTGMSGRSTTAAEE
jgi:hypothetical protein